MGALGHDCDYESYQQLINAAGQEIVLIVGRDEVLTEVLLEQLQEALDTGLAVLIGAQTEGVREQIAEALPDAEVFVSGLSGCTVRPLRPPTTRRSVGCC